MRYLNLLSIAALLASCTGNHVKSLNKDTVASKDTVAQVNRRPAVTDSMLFVRTEGKNNQDSTVVELVVKQNRVTGRMNWLPYEKDSRKGILDGNIKGDTIQVTWHFMQEGMNDTLKLKFRLNSNTLWQKPLKLNVKTGRDQTDETAGYSVIYHPEKKIR